jgi:uroporphyrinogen-III synthase
VGEKTGALAREAGFVPHIGPGDADGLIAGMIATRPQGRLVHLRGKHTRGAVKDRLREAGLDCEDFVTYDQQPQMLNKDAQLALDAQEPVIFPLFSPRTATILREQGPFCAPVHVIALSKAVADAYGSDTARQVTVAMRPDLPAMLTATVDALRAQSGHMG